MGTNRNCETDPDHSEKISRCGAEGYQESNTTERRVGPLLKEGKNVC